MSRVPVAAALVLALALAACDRPGERPNVLLISIDTLRPDHLSGFGYPRETSPNLDRFAESAVVFENAYAHSPHTAPSHMTLLTGLLPEAHGVMNLRPKRSFRLAEGVETLALLLQRVGYRTQAVTDGGNVRAGLGFDVGFDDYYGEWHAAGNFALAEAALEALAGESRPFFLFLHTYQVHDPYMPPEDHVRRFVAPDYDGAILSSDSALRAASEQRLREAARPDEPDAYPRLRAELFWSRVDLESDRDRDHLVALYDAAIHHTDAWLGSLFRRLEALEIADETLVVVVSDHGEAFQEHGEYLHHDVYDEQLRAVLMLRFPGAAPALRIRRPAGLVDVLPTVLETLGLPAPGAMDGRSLWPLIRGEENEPREILAQLRTRNYVALRAGGWKLIRGHGRKELYDLTEDPGERVDLAGREPERLAELASRSRALAARSRARVTSKPQPVGPLDAATRGQLEALGYIAP